MGRVRLVLGRRPTLLAELEDLRSAAARTLGSAVGGDLALDARMADAPARAGRALGHAVVLCILGLEGPGANAVLEIDPRLGAALAARRTGGTAPDAPVLSLTRFEAALLAELLLAVLAALRQHAAAEGRWRPRLLAIGAERAEAVQRLGAGPLVVVDLLLDSAEVRGRAVLLLPELALVAAALAHPERRAPPGPAAGQARLPFSPRLGCGRLWARELRGLACGAAVVVPGARLVDGSLHASLDLVRPGTVLRGELAGPGLRFTGAEARTRFQEVTQVDPVLSEMPVEIEVELAALSLSLAEVAGLQPGAVLPLQVRAGEPVLLRAGDRRIARAELVEIDGQVAARVLELLP